MFGSTFLLVQVVVRVLLADAEELGPCRRARVRVHEPLLDPHYGVVDAAHLLYAVPMVRRVTEAVDATDPVFFLDTDMWDL